MSDSKTMKKKGGRPLMERVLAGGGEKKLEKSKKTKEKHPMLT